MHVQYPFWITSMGGRKASLTQEFRLRIVPGRVRKTPLSMHELKISGV